MIMVSVEDAAHSVFSLPGPAEDISGGFTVHFHFGELTLQSSYHGNLADFCVITVETEESKLEAVAARSNGLRPLDNPEES